MKIIIAGAGEVGFHLAKMLSQGKNQITIVDSSEERMEKIAEFADVITVLGSPTSIAKLEEAGVASADLFIAVAPAVEQDINVVSSILAKRLGAKRVITRINNSEYLRNENRIYFTDMGIDMLFYPERIAASNIIDLITQTGTSEYKDFYGGRLQLVVFRLDNQSPLTDNSFNAIANNNFDKLYRPVAVVRDGKTFIPRRDTIYNSQDLVFVLSKQDGVDEVMDLSGKHNIDVRNLMIVGGGQVGELVAHHMEKKVEHLTIVEKNKMVCEHLTDSLPKSLIINGDARDTDMLLSEGLSNVDVFVAVTSSSEANILSCMAAKNAGVKKTIAQVENLDYIQLAESIGIDTIINKKLITAGRIFRLTNTPNAKSLKYLNGTDAEVLEFHIPAGCSITLKKMSEVTFPPEAIIAGAIRGDSTFIVTGETILKPYDRVVVFARPSAVEAINKLFA